MTIKGLVLSQKNFGENSKFIDILTEQGIVEILVKGSKTSSRMSKTSSASQLFAYSEFEFSERSSRNRPQILTGVRPICIFYDLRKNLSAVALASYFSQIVLYSALPESTTPEALRLFLNTLHFLSEPEPDELLLKAIFELRIAALYGFQPDVVMCRKCGNYLPSSVRFPVEEGCFFCESCHAEGILMPSGALQAIRYIILQDFEKIFFFRLAEHCRKPLADFAEQFLQYHLNRKFPALDYYKKLNITQGEFHETI